MIFSVDWVTRCNLFTKLSRRAARTGTAGRMRPAGRVLAGPGIENSKNELAPVSMNNAKNEPSRRQSIL